MFFFFQSDPENWLQKFDSFNKDKIKLIQPILWKQGFCIEVEDRPAPVVTLKYVCFLYDENRTDNFLSHVRGKYSVSKVVMCNTSKCINICI